MQQVCRHLAAFCFLEDLSDTCAKLPFFFPKPHCFRVAFFPRFLAQLIYPRKWQETRCRDMILRERKSCNLAADLCICSFSLVFVCQHMLLNYSDNCHTMSLNTEYKSQPILVQKHKLKEQYEAALIVPSGIVILFFCSIIAKIYSFWNQ